MKHKRPEFKSFEIKAFDLNTSTNEMIIEGYASIFGNKDEPQYTWIPDIGDFIMCSDIVKNGAYQKTIQDRGQRIAFCKNHDIEDAKGKILEIKEDEKGLFVRIRISDAEPELKTKISEGIYTEFSIGFRVVKANFEKQADNTYVRNITEIKLYEVSIVTIARNELATITDIKGVDNIVSLLNQLIETEKNEIKQLKLNKIRSLILNEPPHEALDNEEPNKKSISQFEFNFN